MTWIIAIRVLLSVSASAVQKRLVSRGAPVPALWMATYLLMLPLALLAAAVTWIKPGPAFWIDSVCGGVFDALGNLAMVAALQATDLSVFGPLNAIRPILALLFGWMFLNETPSAMGLVGILITVLGAVVVLKEDRVKGNDSAQVAKMLGFRLLGFALSTVASVFLKRAATNASAEMTLAGWIVCGLICLLVFNVVKGNRLFAPIKLTGQSPWIVGHAAAFLAMQWLTILIFQKTFLAYSFVFFQLGMVLQVIAGRIFFHETNFGRRMAGCAVMVAGSLCILWKG